MYRRWRYDPLPYRIEPWRPRPAQTALAPSTVISARVEMRCIDPQLKSYTERGHPVRGWLGICISALVCMLVGLAACDRSQDATQSSLPQFSIRWIDETADGGSRRGPPDADRVVNSTTGRGDAGAAWLRREGAL